MANFQTHVGTAAVLGAAYGVAGALMWQLDWGLSLLAAGLVTLGGMLPDLDSDSGRPVREVSIIAAFLFPILLIPRLRRWGFNFEQILVIIIVANLFIRYAMAAIIRRVTVHRGMYHSLPALAIAGIAVFLVYHNDNLHLRTFLAVSVMVGFLSHLILDELYAVNFNGVAITFNAFAGSAIKLYSKSWVSNLITYGLLGGLGWFGYQAVRDDRTQWSGLEQDGGRIVVRQVIRPGDGK